MNFLRGWGQEKTDQATDPVTQAILGFRFPTRAQLEEQTGYSNPFLFKAFWFMYAGAYGMLNHEGKHQPVHYNDVATTSNFRSEESHVKLEPKGMLVAYNHDLEDVGKLLAGKRSVTYSLPSTYVVIDAAHHLLAEESGVDLQILIRLLTDKGNMIFDTVKDYFEARAKAMPGERLSVTPEDLAARLDKIYGGFSINQETVNDFYTKLVQRWQYVLGLLEKDQHKIYLDHDERNYIRNTVNSFMSGITAKLSAKDVLKADDLEAVVQAEHKKVRDIILDGSKVVRIPDELVFPFESVTTLGVEQALYAMYVQPIMDAAIRYANADENPGPVKLLDARDTASKLGPKLENMRNQTLKYSNLLEQSDDVVRKLKINWSRYEIMENLMKFLYFTLRDAVETRRDHFGTYNEDQTQYKDDYHRLVFLANLMPPLGRKIGIIGPTWGERLTKLAERVPRVLF